jgi:hypothetical protein
MTITNGYTTLAVVKAALGIPQTERDDDFYLEATIESVSRMIDSYTERRFYATSETRYYAAVTIDDVYTDDLLTVTTLKTDDDADGTFETTWATSDYHLMPFNAAVNVKPYTRIETSGYGRYNFPVGVKKGVQIAGSFGYCTTANLPKPVAEACKIQSMRLFKRKDAPFGVIAGGEMQQGMTIPDLDPDVKMLLSPFVRRV